MLEHNSTPYGKHQIVFFITKPFQVKLYLIFVFGFLNDKTFHQADEGTVNVLKYTFGNGVNLVSVQQEKTTKLIFA